MSQFFKPKDNLLSIHGLFLIPFKQIVFGLSFFNFCYNGVMEMACPKCGTMVSDADYFCPNCGAKLKEKPIATTVGRQILVYLTCIFLPPFGLWPAVQYLKQGDEKSRIIGIVAIVLTLISIGVTIWLSADIIKTTMQSLSGLTGGL